MKAAYKMDNASLSDNMYQCYLGVGGNVSNELGTPKDHIQNALVYLRAHPSISHVRASSLYASKPLGPQDQPDFINAVIEIDTCLSPQDLLSLCQLLEQRAQRVRVRHWGERSLDVDILLYADKIISTPTLTVPHPGVTLRNFVLIPLSELNPDLKIAGKRITEYKQGQDWTGLTKL